VAKISEAFPSKYLKADDDIPDINDGGLVVTITGAEFETIGQGAEASEKIVLYFAETKKGLVLNKTNAGTITKVLGSDDTDDWMDRKIRLVATDVEFKGDMMRGIRVSSRPVKSEARPKAAPGGKDFEEFDPAPRRGAPGEDAAAAVEQMEV
jgi:hypothetical protein